MKCKSVACIWSSSPPSHRVTAVAALQDPPTVYTGGSDGSIIWWNLSSSTERSEIKPVAMLCGHTSPIADLGVCFPFEESEKEALSNSSYVLEKSVDCGALISACNDGILCVWSRASGHCRCRRKIPPWAGNPFMIKVLPKNKRYVCISCFFVNQEHQMMNSVDGDEPSVDGVLHTTNHLKCSIIIIDSYTLTLVQTVFHGNVLMGPLKSMAVVLSSEDMEKQLVMIIDSFGKVMYIPILKSPDTKGKKLHSVTMDSPIFEQMHWIDDSKNNGLPVDFARCGNMLAHVYRKYCTFRQADSGIVFGSINFSDYRFLLGDKSYVVGGMFLVDDTESYTSGFVQFLAWNNIGVAVVYRIYCSSNTFKCELQCSLPAIMHSHTKTCILFVSLKKYLLRVESYCSHEEHMYWKPRITIWILPQPYDSNEKLCLEFEMVGEGNLVNDWASKISLPSSGGPNDDVLSEKTSAVDEITPLPRTVLSHNEANAYASNQRFVNYKERKLVSASIIISETYAVPYAIIYGFFNGDIEIVRFHMFFSVLGSLIQSTHLDADSGGQKLCLSGHIGAVLCLASHRMVSTSSEWSLKNILVSGSMDCTVRLWDIDSGSSIKVLHQHVAPVRQIIFPPSKSEYPWSDCFLTVGDDSCVSLASLHTLGVERLFPGHPSVPTKVLWDSRRGYIAYLCRKHAEKSEDILYIWDVKTGGRERVLRGAAAHSMFDHFLLVTYEGCSSGFSAYGSTSASSIVFPVMGGTDISDSHSKYFGKGLSLERPSTENINEFDAYEASIDLKRTSAKLGSSPFTNFQGDKHAIINSCPFPGVSTLCFDLTSLLSLCTNTNLFEAGNNIGEETCVKIAGTNTPKNNIQQNQISSLKKLEATIACQSVDEKGDFVSDGSSVVMPEHHEWFRSLKECLLKFSLSFLHFWDIDTELDCLLVSEMKLLRPDPFIMASGLLGDRDSMTLTFPGSTSTLELWRSSSEYCALRSLTMVSIALHLISLSHSYSSACSALATFYTRKLADKLSGIKPPLLQLLISFWQHELEHVKMAARTLFHCSASRAIPLSLCCSKDSSPCHSYHETEVENSASICLMSDEKLGFQGDALQEESVTLWLDSYQVQDWISCVGGTIQDAMTSQIIVAAALAVWYPILVTPILSTTVVHLLIKLVMAMNEKYSAVAGEILAEGMENTWKTLVRSEVSHLIEDVFFQLECIGDTSSNVPAQSSAATLNIRETLVGILLPSLAMVDIPGFLNVIESQIWSTASDSPVHVVSLLTLKRVIRGSPRTLAPYLDKVVSYILLTMDPGNSTMRRSCLQNSMTALKDVVRVFPMISLNENSTRLAVGDAIGEINNATIRVYDMQSMIKIKVLDACGPPGLPSLLGGTSELSINSVISALSFSPDGEGLAAFSENGLMIRWWSLDSVWWEKLSRNLVPAQCTKLIFVPPWEGFSPNSTRSSILSNVLHDDGQVSSPGCNKSSNEDRLEVLLHNLDLSYRFEWVGQRKVRLMQHSHELGIFQL